MEYVGLFLWLSLCLVLGTAIHKTISPTLRYRPMQVLALPGVMARKLAQTVAALVCGSTVTGVKIYEPEPQDITFSAPGASSVAKVLVPVAPLFACALLFQIAGGVLGAQLAEGLSPPSLASLDTLGLRDFARDTWALLVTIMNRGFAADWQSLKVHVLFLLTFSFALGTAVSLENLREALLGAALAVVAVALISGLTNAAATRDAASGLSRTAGWVASGRSMLFSTAAAAFVMLMYGVFLSLFAAIAVRIYEMLARPSRPANKSASTKRAGNTKRLAA